MFVSNDNTLTILSQNTLNIKTMLEQYLGVINILNIIGAMVIAYGLVCFFRHTWDALFKREEDFIPHIIDTNLGEIFTLQSVRYVSHEGPTYDYTIKQTYSNKVFVLRYFGGKLINITEIKDEN